MSPVPFSDRPRSVQVLLAGLIPAAIGALAGVLLGVSSGAYWAVGVVAAIGALFAGFEHPDARSAAARGAIAGAIYGAALLIAHAIAGTHAKVSLGSFPPLLVVITAIIGALLGVVGARLGSR
jgi:hypothetical protein